MDIIEQMIAGHRDIKEREDLLQKLGQRADDDAFSWDDAAMVANYFDTEVRRHVELEEKVLFPVLRSVLPADQREIVDAFEKEHGPLLAEIAEFNAAAQGYLGKPSDARCRQVAQLARAIREMVLPHAANEDNVLFNLVREHFTPDDYRRMEMLYYQFIGV